MDARMWQRVESLFAEAMHLPFADRDDFVRDASGSDAELAREVLSLLGAAATDPGFLTAPFMDLSREAARVGEPDTEERRIDRYRLVRALGRGGMGEVYLAVQEGDDFRRSVAIKLIRHDLLSDDVSRRFSQERRILARLRHPNIASLLDGGTTPDGVPYVAMEFVDGMRLDRFCREQALSVAQRLRLMLHVCDAVQHAHRNLVLHRDLKPANILVTSEGVPKLLDFGIGKLLDGDPVADSAAPVTRTEMRLLTPEYASPEQLRGEPATTASDVFSLGVVLFELLTGVQPWGGTGTTERLAAIEQRAPERPSEAVLHSPETLGRRRELSGDLDTILLKALRAEPERRYRTVDALADDLRRHLDGRPVSARPDTLGYRATRFFRRHRAMSIAAGAVALVSFGAAFTVARQRAQATTRITAERDKLRETQSFLLEMFGAVGPDDAGGGDVSARALLDAQAGRLASYDQRPMVQAEVQYVLADGYQRLGLVDAALPLAHAALSTRERLLDGSDPDVARARSLLGWIERERGHPAVADSLLRDAVGLLRVAAPPAPEALAKALNDLGVVLGDEGHHREAAEVLEEALALRRSATNADLRLVAITANNLAAAYWQLEQRDSALALMDASVAALEASLGTDHGRVWMARANRLIFRTEGEAPEARIEAWRAHLDNAVQRFGQMHREVAWARYLLGAGLLQALPGPSGMQERLNEAVQQLSRAARTADSTFGVSHARTAMILGGLADAHLLRREYAASIAARKRAAAIYAATYGSDYREIGVIWRMQARAEYGRGDSVAGDALARDAWLHHQRAFGTRHVTTLTQQVNVARRLGATGQAHEAVTLLKDAVAGLDSLNPARPALTAQARISLAMALGRSGDAEAADAVLNALRSRVDSLGPSIRRALDEADRAVRAMRAR